MTATVPPSSVVVTGVGMMTPVGLSAEATYAAIRGGISMIGELEYFVIETDWFEEVKPWPQWKDDLFYINFDGVIQEASLGSECSSTNAAKGWGNCFRTREKAIEARDRIESILKEMSDLEK